MNSSEFLRVCWEASVTLGLPDLTALGKGLDFVYEDVHMKTYFDGDACLLVATVGNVAPEDFPDVCEILLALQLAAWDQPLVRFGQYPLDEALVLCAHVDLDEPFHAGTWATLVQSVAAQVAQWRNVHLAGRVHRSRAQVDGYFAVDQGTLFPYAAEHNRAES